MKRCFIKTELCIVLIFFITNAFPQNQLKKWYLANQQIDMTQQAPLVSNIPNSTIIAANLGTGLYKSDNFTNIPQFYIADGNIYDGTNNFIGNLPGFTPSYSPELPIIPFLGNDGCNQNKYYLLYNSPNFGSTNLKAAIIDMTANNCHGQLIGDQVIASISGIDIAGIAVGKENVGQRYIYYAGGNVIKKIVLTSSGFSSAQTLFTFSLDLDNMELDLSPDGSMLAFVYTRAFGASNPYFIVSLDVNGNYISHSTFNVGSDFSSGGRGVEFYSDPNGVTQLLVGAGANGIYKINPLSPSVGQYLIAGTNGYGNPSCAGFTLHASTDIHPLSFNCGI